ncbi:MAG: cytochrome B5, partial [Tissierellales bacterium]|nr:cytochrome B5 [Tissierellales bacterium]
MTLEELKSYDGQNGNPAYIAIDGIIYDVSNVSQWKNGTHNGQTAGNNLSDQIASLSP